MEALAEPGEHDAEIDELFSDRGALARGIDDFRPRQSQTDMARAVADAIVRRATLLAEADRKSVV